MSRIDGNDLLPEHVEAYYSFCTRLDFPVHPSVVNNPALDNPLLEISRQAVYQATTKEKFTAYWKEYKAQKGWMVK